VNDENTSQVLAAQRVQAAATRQVTVDVLTAAATACVVAAGTVLALMVLVWLVQPGHDFPGRFWFAVLPLLGAAITFKVHVSGIGAPRRDRG
jgi:hypothetical protein